MRHDFLRFCFHIFSVFGHNNLGDIMKFSETFSQILEQKYSKDVSELSVRELYDVTSCAVNAMMLQNEFRAPREKRAAYFSAEFLIGSLIKSDLQNLGVMKEAKGFFEKYSRSLDELDTVPDFAFGNGGLGRLAACFLESAASCDMNLDGYGIRYDYGLFKQKIEECKQTEYPDDWSTMGDPLGIRKNEETVEIDFSDMTVKAVPYDYLVPGYKNKKVNRLRLYSCEEKESVDFDAFENHDFSKAFKRKTEAKSITAFLYPNDSDEAGKRLRLRQQYFLVSAALQNILSECYDEKHYLRLPELIAVQLNDTHPTVAIPEFIRLLVKRGKNFDEAFSIASKVFSYTNHTVMSEALEKWDEKLFESLLPRVYEIVVKINAKLIADLKKKTERLDECLILKDGFVHMANLACFVCNHINGVAQLHSSIIEKNTLSQWYEIFPERFSNKTNGITFRRWLALSNEDLYFYLCRLLKADVAEKPENIKKLSQYAEDDEVLEKLYEFRQKNKNRLCDYIRKNEHISLDSNSVFLVQIKRIHEYKRQLLSALGAFYLYVKMKNGELSDLPALTFILGGKAASGYREAKLIIEFINILSEKINLDDDLNERIKMVFVSDYNVSKAQRLIPAADFSLQLSLAGTEASGTGNMKFMLNGAPTIGTFDGANIEIVKLAGEENNYIFGLREEEVSQGKTFYNPKDMYETSDTVKTVIDALSDSTSLRNDECFEKIKTLLLENDRYMVLADLESFVDTVERAARDYKNKKEYFKKALYNTAASSFFSSDRTIREYGDEIWNIPIKR